MPLPEGARGWDVGLAARAGDGTAIRAALWSPGGAKGLAVLSPGRTEFLEKAALPATALADRGYAVVAADWRGQGLSQRLADDPLKGHVDDFADFADDLRAVLALPEVVALGPVQLAFGHSMGGAITMEAMRRGAMAPEAVLLSAPMLGLAGGSLRNGATRVMAEAASAIGLGEHWPPLPDPATPYVFQGFEDNCLTGDAAMYAWLVEALKAAPALQLGLPTLGWLRAAYRVIGRIEEMRTVPPMHIIVGSREGVVDRQACVATAERLGAACTVIEGALHELPMELPRHRAAFWEAAETGPIGPHLAR
ncbi:MAG: alpha/beta hydrolase [Pseudomonadota bacterium]